MAERNTSELYQSIQADLEKTIMKHLKTPAISLSSLDAKRTGSAYQSVRLGDQVVSGFRSARREVFAGVELKNKSVVDLGSNLGEVAREAARGGAASVLGIEYDRYFVQMSRLIAAHEDLGNVGFVQGDLTNAETYGGRYDIVVALSVFAYVKGFLAKLAEMANELLIMETHAVKENWDKQYIKLLSRHFRYVAVVGVSDHRASSKSDWRYLLYCSQKPLDGILARRARELRSSDGLSTLDMSRSTIRHLDRFLDVISASPGNLDKVITAASTHLRERSQDEAIEQIGKSGLVFSPLYWCHFLVGYREYRNRNRLDRDNTYYRLLSQLVERGLYDGAFKSLLKRPDGGIPRLEMRYKMIDELLGNGDEGASLDPVILYNILSPEYFPANGPGMQFHLSETGGTVSPIALDGHHRTFAAYVSGARRLRAVPIWYKDIKSVLGFIRRNPRADEALWGSIYPFSQKLAGSAATPDNPASGGCVLVGE